MSFAPLAEHTGYKVAQSVAAKATEQELGRSRLFPYAYVNYSLYESLRRS